MTQPPARREGLDEDLHASTELQDGWEGRPLLNVVIQKCLSVHKLLACKDQVLIRQDAEGKVNGSKHATYPSFS